MTDIVQRLRRQGDIWQPGLHYSIQTDAWMAEAADEIDRLRGELLVRHDATTCREVTRQQHDTIKRLSAELDRLTAENDALRTAGDRLASLAKHRPACPNYTQAFPETACLCGQREAFAAWQEVRGDQ